jgi:hypothetical protein
MVDLFGLALDRWVKAGSEVAVDPVFALELFPLNSGSLRPPKTCPCIRGVWAKRD